jgi:probable blue pigment (indigoidine) exporter
MISLEKVATTGNLFYYYCKRPSPLKQSFTRYLLTGITFSVLWSSASIAGKFGLTAVEPLVFFTMRFLLAGGLLLLYCHAVKSHRLPAGIEWRQLFIFGTFNTALYLGIFIYALQYITAGITALAIALNPLFISLMSSFLSKRKVTFVEWISIVLGIAGVFLASFPLLNSKDINIIGLLLLALSMITYSYGSVYYSSVQWKLSRVTINGWQVFMGGLLVLPFAFLFHTRSNQFDTTFWISLIWLIFPVSILAVQLWLVLLKADAVRASIWLYLCPIFGLLFSSWLLHEPLTYYTLVGTILVLCAVFIGQRKISPPTRES